jgi:aspartate racemase
MKRLGVVGGIGPESTIAYYRLIIAAVRERWPDHPQAPVLINSIDVQKGPPPGG